MEYGYENVFHTPDITSSRSFVITHSTHFWAGSLSACNTPLFRMSERTVIMAT